MWTDWDRVAIVFIIGFSESWNWHGGNIKGPVMFSHVVDTGTQLLLGDRQPQKEH